MINKIDTGIKSSFRDPSGFTFVYNGLIYRQVNLIYKQHYDYLMSSGLYKALSNSGLLIPHSENNLIVNEPDNCYKTIQPESVPFISYPYEWSFSQLKHAALTTLEIQRTALNFGMTLKDASAYNIQFRNGKPIFIDTLSFEIYKEGSPWVAYKQFCQHFLAPLGLMSYTDIRLNQLLRIYIDGIPLDLADKLLPFRAYFRFSLLAHIYLHAKSQKHFGNKEVDINKHKISRLSLLGLIDNLMCAVKGLNWKPKGTEWADYYENSNYSEEAMEYKKQILTNFLDKINPKSVWDFGANRGMFSRIASNRGLMTISFDADNAAVERNYLECVEKSETNILPLLLDLTNPTSAVGWDNEERMSLRERGPADVVMALALVHHLAISNNMPFKKLAEFFSKYGNWLIIEFIPKNDSNAKWLLKTREDIFSDYTETNFREEFNKFFQIVESVKIKDSERIVYLMKNRGIK
ncbi:MAG: SAM-dependent methyltransferase [Sedimentisphaerales bacterium]